MNNTNPSYYREKLAEQSAFWADLYALTMSQALFTNGKHNINTTFHAYIRKPPFGGAYLISAGQNIIAEWLNRNWKFDDLDIGLMEHGLNTKDPVTGLDVSLFAPKFIKMCKKAKLQLTVDMVPEGDLVFPNEPIVRVHGPAWQCLMVEAAILNCINSQSLFATLTARLKEAMNVQSITSFTLFKDRDPLLEFGLRRAQCLGGLEPARAAYLAGADGTSNLLARKYYGIPAMGTFAHALVMMYEDEIDAFADYAKAMPHNGIFLVDTYNTLEGVRRAIAACKKANVKLKGIRLDSGDLAHLSIEARKILDAAGFTDTKIAASNDLDEEKIIELKMRGAKIDIWGVGTNLVTSSAQPSLGAVYKVGAVYDPRLTMDEIQAYRDAVQQGNPSPSNLQQFLRKVIKLGEKPSPGEQEKATIPGELGFLRAMYNDTAANGWRYDGDVIFSMTEKLPYRMEPNPTGPYNAVLTQELISVPMTDPTAAKTFPVGTPVSIRLQEMFNKGTLTGTIETIHDARPRVPRELALLAPDHRQLKRPYQYGVGLEKSLFDQRQATINAIRGRKP